jgi:type I restriction enzyme, S subunit
METVELLDKYFETAFAAPDGIKRLRELILTLAMQGKLVPQNSQERSASELLKEIEVEKKRLIKEGKIKKSKPLPDIAPDEIPYDLPNSWEWVRLDNIASYIQRGKSPKYVDKSDFPVISQKCVQWRGLEIKKAKFICSDSLKKYAEERFLKTGDLLWNSTGLGTLGRVGIYIHEENVYEKVVADSHVTVIRPIFIESKFLYFWIASDFVQSEIEAKSSGSTKQIELATSTIKNHLFPLPPLDEQHRIVEKIDRLMEQVDRLEKLQKERDRKQLIIHSAASDRLLKASDRNSFNDAWNFIQENFNELYSVKENINELRKAILQLAVMGKLVPQNPKDPPASELLKEIEAEKKRLIKEGKIKKQKPLPEIKPEEIPYELPKSWIWCRVENLAELITSGSRNWAKYYSNSGAIFVTMGNLSRGNYQLRMDNIRYVKPPQDSEGDRTKLEPNDLLISITGDVGNLGLIPENFGEAYINQHTCLLRFMYQCRNRYFPEFMRSPLAKGQFDAPQRGVKNSFRLGDVGEMIVPLPPLDEQHRIVEKIDRLMALCDKLEEQLTNQTEKQNTLLEAVLANI